MSTPSPCCPLLPPCTRALHAQVLSHLWLVRCEARRYAGTPYGLEDLESEGVLALLRAAERFEARGLPFATYARPWVRGALRAFAARSRAAGEGEATAGSEEALASADPGAEELLLRSEDARWLHAWLLAQPLDARERAILERRLLAPEDAAASTAQLAAELGLSTERIRQLERALLLKLRRGLQQSGPAHGVPHAARAA